MEEVLGMDVPYDNSQWDPDDIDDYDGPGLTSLHDLMIYDGLVEGPEKKMSHDDITAQVKEIVDDYRPEEHLSLQELEEDDIFDEDIIQTLRRKRIAELKAAKSRAKYNQVLLVYYPDFEREVKEASHKCDVVLLVFLPGQPPSMVMETIFNELAEKFRAIKFTKLYASSSIKGFPIDSCPTVMTYRKGKVVKQFETLSAFSGSSTNADVVEWQLFKLGFLETDLENDPSLGMSRFKMQRK